MQTMTTDALVNLLNDTDARIREQEILLQTTPADTAAHAAMTESRPALLRFRASVADELWNRGV